MFKRICILFTLIFVGLTSSTSLNWDYSDCKVKCAAISIPGTSPTMNGCGSYNVKLDFSRYNALSGFNNCCNNHDVCYNTCNSTKSSCDSTFNSCLKNAVATSSVNYLKKLQNYAIAKTMYETVRLLGCPAYILGMGATCQCP